MTLAVEKLYTPQDLLDDPKLAGHELVGGHLVEKPVSKRSSLVAGEIHRLLSNEARKTREASVYPNDMGYQCFANDPNDIRLPDVSLVRAERESQIEGDPGYMPIPADLAVEVPSPTERVMAVDDKVDEYLEAGFGLVWVVNPQRRHVHIYRPDGSVQLLSEKEEITGEKALPGFRCKVAEFFDV